MKGVDPIQEFYAMKLSLRVKKGCGEVDVAKNSERHHPFANLAQIWHGSVVASCSFILLITCQRKMAAKDCRAF